MAFIITTPAFENGAKIPVAYTCDGEDISPPLAWKGEPEGTASYALIVEDPDAPGGTYIHWILYNIPADVHQLENITKSQTDPDTGSIQARNDFGDFGYGGPCPPGGQEHRYYFRIYALRKMLPANSIKEGSRFHEVIRDFILGRSEFMGRYARPGK